MSGFTLTAEGDGYVLTCRCRWLRWFPGRTEADAGRREHAKRCKATGGSQ